MTPVLAAGALLFRWEEGELLFLLLKNARHGSWGFPKGHAEAGESPETCARREIREETGMEITHFLPGFKEVLHYHVPPATREDGDGDYDKEVHYFVAPAPSSRIQRSKEHRESAWLSIEAAKEKLQIADLRLLLDKAGSFLRSKGVTDGELGDKNWS
ncbi:MAG TPA: NUDIX domain-containing protein [Planctomycetes bacterium]|nr:NUDIX domain-containing protein [Planctomycetota bacterium]